VENVRLLQQLSISTLMMMTRRQCNLPQAILRTQMMTMIRRKVTWEQLGMMAAALIPKKEEGDSNNNCDGTSSTGTAQATQEEEK
jgi:hypothetical protein